MHTLINNIKQKPEPIRQRWVLFLAGAGTFLAFIVWMFSLTAGSSSPVLVLNDSASPASVAENSDYKSPFLLGLEVVGDQFVAVGQGWQVLTKKVKLIFE